MLPDLTVLVALLVGLGALQGAAADPARALLGSIACFVVGGALSRMALARGQAALAENDELLAEAKMRSTTIWPFVAWIAAIVVFDWGPWVHAHVPQLWWIARYLVLFAPMLAVYAIGWGSRAILEGELIRRRGGIAPVRTARDGVRRGLRRNGIVFIPLAIVIALTDGLWLAGELGVEPLRIFSLWREASGLIDIAIMFSLVLLALPWIPLIFAKALHAEPLAPGRTRTVLETAAKKINLRYRNIMVWRTGGRAYNAMVVGFTNRTRLIFITDALLAAMPEDELLAVFFHEAGHAKKNHLQLFLVLFFSLSLIFYAATGPMQELGVPPWVQLLLHLAAIWFIILGWVSRRFERESDIYGAEHASVLDPDAPAIPVPGLPRPLPRGAAMMVRALERIRAIVGYSGSHRHGSVEDRITYVAHHAIDPGTRLAHSRAMRGLKFGIFLAFLAGVAFTVLQMPDEVAHAESHVLATNALRDYESAWDLDHADDVDETEKASARWRLAFDGFVNAAKRLDGVDDYWARQRLVQHSFNAGDTALHGLRDAAAAKPWFEQALRLADEIDPDGRTWTRVRFAAHIELGRIKAWAAEANPGERGPDFAETLGHLAEAKSLAQLDAQQTGRASTLLDERLRLLQATYDGARGEVALARRALELLAQLGKPGEKVHSARQELAEDARRELERLKGR